MTYVLSVHWAWVDHTTGYLLLVNGCVNGWVVNFVILVCLADLTMVCRVGRRDFGLYEEYQLVRH